MADEEPRTDIVQLVAQHHQVVYQYAFRLAGSAPDAEDLTQQTFLVAQENLGQLRKLDSSRSWLFAILRNCFLKGRKRRRPVPAADLRLDIDAIPAEIPESEDVDAGQLLEALNQLPDDFRLVLLMFYFEGCLYREIAQRLDLPMGTVMSRLARAKGHLRSKLRVLEQQGART